MNILQLYRCLFLALPAIIHMGLSHTNLRMPYIVCDQMHRMHKEYIVSYKKKHILVGVVNNIISRSPQTQCVCGHVCGTMHIHQSPYHIPCCVCLRTASRAHHIWMLFSYIFVFFFITFCCFLRQRYNSHQSRNARRPRLTPQLFT